jgi:vacuolar protein sorting-associated protein IST1
MATQRIRLAVNKKSNGLKHQKREIATLLGDQKIEKARIKVEHIIREDFNIEAYEIIELLCELIHERVNYISSCKECPPDIKEAICSIIWATNRVEISELSEVKKQLTKKFGTKFAEQAEDNNNNCVNERLVAKLSVQPPSQYLVNRYLEELAKEFGVEWTALDMNQNTDLTQPICSPDGFSIPMAPGTQLRSAYQRTDVSIELSSVAVVV